MIATMVTVRDNPTGEFQDSLELDHAQAARQARDAIAHDTAEANAVNAFREFVAAYAALPGVPAPRLVRVSRPVRSFAGAGQHGMETINDPQGRSGWPVVVPPGTAAEAGTAAEVRAGAAVTSRDESAGAGDLSGECLVGTDGHVYVVHDSQDVPVPAPSPALLAALQRTMQGRRPTATPSA